MFRSPCDSGNVRQQSTPSSVQLMKNLDSFVEKWLNCEFNGWKIINHKALLQINALKIHITKGCLSNIIIGGGTNKNEALHRHINPHFKLGLPLALALLTILFHQYNCHISQKLSGTTQKNVHLSRYLSKLTTSPATSPARFGVLKKEHIPTDLTWVLSKASIHTLETAVPDHNSLCADITLTDICADLISVDEAVKLLSTSLHITTVATYMKKISLDSPLFNYRFLPFMSCVSNIKIWSLMWKPMEINLIVY